MRGNPDNIQNKTGIRHVPKSRVKSVLYDDVLAVKSECQHSRKCRGGCGVLVKEGQQAWYSSGEYYGDGEDRWWHDKCL